MCRIGKSYIYVLEIVVLFSKLMLME